jgi:putative transposase
MPLYHVWFATKRRRWLLQEEVGGAAKELMRTVAEEKSIRLLECETIVDHVHLLVAAEDTTRLSKAMNLLKGITSRRILQRVPRTETGCHGRGLLAASVCSKVRS